ncbi:MAG TPA: CopG family transcriptional regulator [Candidatus Limiplasma sp.]|nr:CopG family transcriptional regulator [Candidatus Limiplasma sp.]
MSDEIRLGFIGIVLDTREAADEINHIIGQYSDVVKARIGVPNATSASAVIGLIVEGENLTIGSLTAKLGNLKGVQVKSALSKKK